MQTAIDEKDIARFWSYVDRSTRQGPAGDCWLWRGALTRKFVGYGYVKVKGKMYRAHRLSWVMAHGPIPDGMIVCHKCDIPCCVNPAHLFIGTNDDNVRDRCAKGRTAVGRVSGERNGMAKLTAEQVMSIRQMRLSGLTYQKIADEFSVDNRTVRLIVAGECWKHV